MSLPASAAATSPLEHLERLERVDQAVRPKATSATNTSLDFLALYDAHFAFVWRSVRRLGVEDAAIDDVVQETFVVVHRRLSDFEGRSALKTWLFSIVLHVVRDHRRTRRRKRPPSEHDVEMLVDEADSPHESLERARAVRVLHALLDTLDDDQREVFVLSELEQLTAVEIAEVTGVNVNTLYARLRSARKAFESAVSRHLARTANDARAGRSIATHRNGPSGRMP